MLTLPLQYPEFSEGKTLASVTNRGPVINDLEYLFAATSLQTFIKMASEGGRNKNLEEDINKEASVIAKKTLLLQEYLTQLTQDEIKANYKYPVKVVSEREVIQTIMDKAPGYVYAYVNHRMLSCGTKFNHFIMDCESGKPLLLDKRNGLSLGTTIQMDIFDDIQSVRSLTGKGDNVPSPFKQKYIKARQLKKYQEVIEGKYDDKEEEEKGDEEG